MSEKDLKKQDTQEVEIVNTDLDSLENALIAAERLEEKVRKVKIIALKQTNALDWVDQNGKPYLQISGSQKIARLFGISWKIRDIKKDFSDDEQGKYYTYTYIGEFSMGGKSIEVSGFASQKDKFLGLGSDRKKKNINEVDEGNIMKKAETNMIGRGIKAILGINNLTWEDVKSGGVNKDNVSSVKYAEGGAGGGKISEAQRKRLFAICKQSGKQETEIKEFLKKQYKIESTNDIKTKDYDAICKWATETTNDGIEME